MWLLTLKDRKDEGLSFMTATHPTPLDRQSYLAEHITDELLDLSLPSPKIMILISLLLLDTIVTASIMVSKL